MSHFFHHCAIVAAEGLLAALGLRREEVFSSGNSLFWQLIASAVMIFLNIQHVPRSSGPVAPLIFNPFDQPDDQTALAATTRHRIAAAIPVR